MPETIDQILARLPISSRYIQQLNILVHLGEPAADVEDDSDDSGVSYRPELGIDLNLLPVGDDDTDDSLLHEIAHWIVAAPYRRRLLNYGLGEGFLDANYKSRLIVSEKAAQWEEERACALCIVIVHKLNPPWKLRRYLDHSLPAWVQTADSVQWFNYHGYQRREVTHEQGLELAYRRIARIGLSVADNGDISGVRLTPRKTHVRI